MPTWNPYNVPPNASGDYLLFVNHETMAVGYYSTVHKLWAVDGGRHIQGFTHWMPLPDPPFEETSLYDVMDNYGGD